MRRGPKLAELTLSSEQQEQLESVAASTSMPHGVVMRARLIFACAEGLSNAAVAAKVGASPQAVGKWRRRFPWSVRLMAEAVGVSKSTVQRWFSLFGVKPHLRATFKLSTDPFFIEKVRDIVGLYLDPPEHALVLCVDEKSQIQALERS